MLCVVQTINDNLSIVRELSDETLMNTFEFGVKQRDPYVFELVQRAVQVPICTHRHGVRDSTVSRCLQYGAMGCRSLSFVCCVCRQVFVAPMAMMHVSCGLCFESQSRMRLCQSSTALCLLSVGQLVKSYDLLCVCCLPVRIPSGCY
jgi:hypothetical protein